MEKSSKVYKPDKGNLIEKIGTIFWRNYNPLHKERPWHPRLQFFEDALANICVFGLWIGCQRPVFEGRPCEYLCFSVYGLPARGEF